MFSGIKSIFFGYSETDAPTSGSTESALQNDPTTSNEKTSFSHDTSALLEQTLNAATTKFTEQLLPQSPSIEELQSSSRQLLPTLNEQHEEDETKRKKQVEKENIVDSTYDEDDDCFNADSWELLDLVEKPEASKSSSTVQRGSVNNNSSGILKQSNKKASSTKARNQSNQRQKPKVSFETPDQPDLVSDKPRLCRKKPKGLNAEARGANASCDKKQNKTLSLGDSKSGKEDVRSGNLQEPCSSSMVMSMISYESPMLPEENQAVKKSTLNYAAALSANLKKNSKNKDSHASSATLEKSVSLPEEVKSEKDEYITYRGTVKRNRPVSTSSWSSDDIETVDSTWNDVQSSAQVEVELPAPVAQSAGGSDVSNEDNESVVSSGFSDCDYGYEGLNDYVMRPKKTQNKKRRGLNSSSNWLVNSMSRRGNENEQASSDKDSGNNTSAARESKTSCAKINATSSKNIKPKKKKLVLSPSSGQSSFFKKQQQQHQQQDSGNLQVVLATVSNDDLKSTSNNAKSDEQSAPVAAPSTLMPPPPPLLTATPSSSASEKDSSDVAEMDESWYVTPPPCFTGSNKLGEAAPPAAKEAARENALIEHPSIYIPMSQKQQKQQQKRPLVAKIALTGSSKANKKPSDEATSKHTAIVLRKVGKQTPTISSNSGSSSGSDSSQAKRKSTVAVQPVEKKSAKAWENKFIVTNWSYDEQDDINDDFDNLWETDEAIASTVSPKSKTSSSATKTKKTQNCQTLKSEPFSMLEMSAGYESDVSLPAPVLEAPIAVNQSELSNEMLQSLPDEDSIKVSETPTLSVDNENSRPSSAIDSSRRRIKSTYEKKAPILVRPIEPERLPGWQLRKKRSKRRPLSASMANICSAVAGGSNRQSIKITSSASESLSSDATDSNLSSARSTPTLIDRISSSIVANLTNLTSGFPAAALPIQARANIEEVEKLNQSVAKRVSSECALASRRRMAKGYLDRQNNCVKVANSSRRADRRLKMHSTPNGYSIDRKVQTNFH